MGGAGIASDQAASPRRSDAEGPGEGPQAPLSHDVVSPRERALQLSPGGLLARPGEDRDRDLTLEQRLGELSEGVDGP